MPFRLTKSSPRLWSLDAGVAMVVTDLHGDWDAYARYRERFIELHAAGQADCLIVAGDLIHREPDAGQDRSLDMVLDILALRERYGDAVISLCGNHELPHLYGFVLGKGRTEYTPGFEAALSESGRRGDILALFQSLPFFIRTVAGVSITHAGASAPLADRAQAVRLFDWDHQVLRAWAEERLAEGARAELRSGYAKLSGESSYEALARRYLAVSGSADPRYDDLLRGFFITAHPDFRIIRSALFIRCEQEDSEAAYTTRLAAALSESFAEIGCLNTQPPTCGMIWLSKPIIAQGGGMSDSIARAQPLVLPDLPTLPPVVLWLLGSFLQPILTWVEALLVRAVLVRCAAHPLVRIAQTYDPAAVVAACASYRHPAGTTGAPPTFSIEPLMRAEIVRAWADSCSDPELEWLLASNLLIRHFVGLRLLAASPDHSTLNRFHAFLSAQAPDALFCDVLAFLDHRDPEDPATTPQIVDTFALASPVAPAPSVASLLRDLTRRLALTWMTHAPSVLQSALPPLDLSGLVRMDAPRPPQEAQQRLAHAVSVATWVADGLTPHLAGLPEPFRRAIATQVRSIRKVIADATSTDAAGVVQERPASAKGAYRLASAVDLEATFRKHEGDPAVLGSNAVVSTTSTRIRAAVILTGSTPDSQAPVAVLRQLQTWQVPLPAVLIMDQAGGMGKTRADVAAVSHSQTTLVARVPPTAAEGSGQRSASAFVLSADGQTLRCPNGQLSTRQYPHPASDGVRFTFGSGQCRGCPRWNACRGSASKPNTVRFVYVTAYQAYVRAAVQFNQTDAGKALLKGRWQVEPTIAWLVRYHGCRVARRVGLAAARCQLLMACAVRNLLLWLRRQERRQ